MNAPRLTDAQISKALRAHLPDRAYPGLRERVLNAAADTGQQRALPSFLGALSDADPVVRRQSFLIAAALLVALALTGVVAVGASRLLQRDPLPELNLERPTDVQALVLSTHERMTQLPPLAITTLKSDATTDRIYVDRSGAVRLERYASADATEPFTSMLLSGTYFGRTLIVGANTVWVEQADANGDDPRVWIYHLSGLTSGGGSGCEMIRDSSEAGNWTGATAWRYVGADSVAGRPAHHLACAGDEIWIDDETRLILRVRQQVTDDAGDTIPGAFQTTEVTKIEFGEQPAALFAFEPPSGVAAMPMEAYLDLCPGDTGPFLEGPPCSGTPRPAEVIPTLLPEPSPTPIVGPKTSDCAVPPGDPSEPTGPLAWTPASLTEDWPAPIRPEPAGGASVVPMPPTYIDPSGDTGSASLACVDIRDVTVDPYVVSLDLVSKLPPDVDPSKAWIAYGVVVDDDRDGVPDRRYGIDNLPRAAGDDEGHHRAWGTDLHTGRTESDPQPRIDRPYRGEDGGQVGDTFFGTSYPAGDSGDARFRFGRVSDTTGGSKTQGVKLDMPLYAWASVIVNGRVVATDYAPDAGWLLPSPGAKPGGTYVIDGLVSRRAAAAGVLIPVRLSMSVPSGWTADYSYVHRDRNDESTGLEFMIIDHLAEWGCDASGDAIEAKIGPKVDDLVTFLASQQMLKISDNTDLTLDGYRGSYLEYTTAIRDDNCHGYIWPLATHQDQSHHEYNQVWILDVDGVRLVIDAFAPKASEAVKAEFRQIVESIDIGP
jgi:hypothetical protein